MTIRPKLLRLIALTSVPFEQTIDGITEQFKTVWENRFRESSPEAAEAVAIFTNAMKARLGVLEDAAVSIFERQFSEQDVDALLSFYESPVYQKLIEVSPGLYRDLVAATDEWKSQTLKSVESELAGKLPVGDLAVSVTVAEPQSV